MIPFALELAALTDTGTLREHNEDACGSVQEAGDRAILAVADGVSSAAGGEVASQMAIEVLLRACAEQEPSLPAGRRLYQAVQQANIEIYDRAVAVPELRGMCTTLTAVAVERGELTAVHVGDTRLYLLRAGTITQLTKDHTVAGGRQRMGLLSKERARQHAEKSVLTRSMGRELIVSRDRIGYRLDEGDALLLCSDGLHGVLDDDELLHLAEGQGAAEACRALVSAANARGTPDNLTAAVLRLAGPVPARPGRPGLAGRLRGLLGGG